METTVADQWFHHQIKVRWVEMAHLDGTGLGIIMIAFWRPIWTQVSGEAS